jgi:hypothetical protein
MNPLLRDGMGEDEGRYAQGGIATSSIGDVKRPHLGVRLPKELGALR